MSYLLYQPLFSCRTRFLRWPRRKIFDNHIPSFHFRKFSTTKKLLDDITNQKANDSDDYVNVHWILKDGTKKTVKGKIGTNLLELAHKNNIDLEGACEGSLACSTCHVIVVDEKFYKMLPEPTDEENDMLDLAFGLTNTSRLGCQVKLTKELDGLTVQLPAATRNMAVDGYVPKPH